MRNPFVIVPLFILGLAISVGLNKMEVITQHSGWIMLAVIGAGAIIMARGVMSRFRRRRSERYYRQRQY